MPKGKSQSAKSRGRHTTYLDTNWMKKFVKNAKKEPTVQGINLGPITKKTGKTNYPYSAKKVHTGIEIIVFASRQKQLVILHTTCPKKTAKALKLQLKGS